jgi:hypothetical protein
MAGDFESLYFVSLFLWTGRPLPWSSLRPVLRLKNRAFRDPENFYETLFAGEVPEHVRRLGAAVQDEGAVVDYNVIQQILSGHGVEGPIDFDALLLVKKKDLTLCLILVSLSWCLFLFSFFINICIYHSVLLYRKIKTRRSQTSRTTTRTRTPPAAGSSGRLRVTVWQGTATKMKTDET